MDTKIFQNITDINIEKYRITSFYYIENTLKLFLGVIKNIDKIHPLDYVIESLGCNIIELNSNSEEEQYIRKFLTKTGAKDIKGLFKITQSIYDINFNPNNYTNRYIFCHGTKTENILGILSQGLKISPIQAKFTGKSFGEGIYLSDQFSVSLQYSKNALSNSKRHFVLLVEAALGYIDVDYTVHNTKLDFDNAYRTKEGYGIFNFQNNYQSTFGGVIVIKNEMNVKVKYIVEV